MRREKKQQNKTKLIADVFSYIADGHKLEDTREMAKRLCKFYFPNADDVFVEIFCAFAWSLQQKYWFEQDFDFVLRQYK